jgi:hypothetical protein
MKTSTVSLEQRIVMTEEELRSALQGLASMKLMQANAEKGRKLVRVVLVMETPDAPKAPESSGMEVRWNPFGR